MAGRMRILMRKSKRASAAIYIQVESALVRWESYLLFASGSQESCGLAGAPAYRGGPEGTPRGDERHALPSKRRMRGGEPVRREMDFVVRSGADGIFAGLEPFQAGEDSQPSA